MIGAYWMAKSGSFTGSEWNEITDSNNNKKRDEINELTERQEQEEK